MCFHEPDTAVRCSSEDCSLWPRRKEDSCQIHHQAGNRCNHREKGVSLEEQAPETGADGWSGGGPVHVGRHSDQRAAIAVLNVGGMHNGVDQQTFRVDESHKLMQIKPQPV
jgi:hypothetical protein